MESADLAVYDVDGTLFKSACVEKVIDQAIASGVFSTEAFATARERRQAWQANNNEGIYQSYLHHLVGGFVSSIAGVNMENLDRVVQEVVREHKVRRFAYTQSLAQTLQWSHSNIAISGSPQFVIEPFLADLPFDSIIGSYFEVQNGYYTGVAKGTKKAEVLAESFCNRSIEVGVGDTIGDLPVLEAAKCPIAFNPSATLRRHAVKKGWYIVMEQKDAVTQLLPREGAYQAVFDRDPHIVLEAAGVNYGQ